MKNRINLFKQKPHEDYLSVHAGKFKNYLTFAGILLFVLFLFLVKQILELNKTEQELLKKKTTYLKYLLDEKENEANMRYFKAKQIQVNTFLKEDAQFLFYYSVLKKSLEDTGGGAILDTFNIDKERHTDFIVKFNSFGEMLSFLSYVEKDAFLKNFQMLSLKQFNIDQRQAEFNRYKLDLEGIFKELAPK